MNVQDIMTKDVLTVRPDMTVRELAELFVAKDISGAPVVDDRGKLLGLVLEESLIVQDKKVHLPTFLVILSGVIEIGESRFERDMLRIAAVTVGGIMDKNPPTVSPETSIEDAATRIVENGTRYFLVMAGDALVGVLTKRDIVRAIAQRKI